MGRRLFVAALLFTLVGCRERLGPERVKTVPVTGKVTVDGLPAPDVGVTFHSVETPKDHAATYTAQPSARTDAEGAFSLSTYEQGDGVAAGTYTATFTWQRFDPIGNRYGGPDRLNNRYSDPKTSPFKVTIDGDETEPKVLNTFALTTK